MYKVTKATIVLACLLVAVLLAACSSAEPSQISKPAGNTNSGAPNASSPPAGAMPSAPPAGTAKSGEMPAGAIGKTGGPEGFGQGSMGQNSPSTTALSDLTNSVVGTGSVTVGRYANLYFGSSGQIASITVKESDQVTKSTLLAQLDTATLESTLAQYQANISQAQVSIDQVQQNLLQAQQNLVTAQQNLNAQKDIQEIQTKINNANIQLQQARVMLKAAQSNVNGGETDYWKREIVYLVEDTKADSTSAAHTPDGGLIAVLQNKMTQMLEDPTRAGASLVSDATAATEIQRYTLAVQIAEQTITTYRANLTLAQSNLNTAQKNLELVKRQIAQATISAPFNGLIARVNSQIGDVVAAPAQAQSPVIYLIDPDTLQLDVYVNELDLPKVKLQQNAIVRINAYPESRIEGVVTAIAPLPTTSGGVIYYKVIIGFRVPDGLDIRIGMNGSATLESQ